MAEMNQEQRTQATALVDKYLNQGKHFKRIYRGDYFRDDIPNYLATTKGNLIDLLIEFAAPLQEQIDELKKENEELKKIPDSQLSPLGYAIRHSINSTTPTFKISEDNKPSNPDSA